MGDLLVILEKSEPSFQIIHLFFALTSFHSQLQHGDVKHKRSLPNLPFGWARNLRYPSLQANIWVFGSGPSNNLPSSLIYVIFFPYKFASITIIITEPLTAYQKNNKRITVHTLSGKGIPVIFIFISISMGVNLSKFFSLRVNPYLKSIYPYFVTREANRKT